MLKPSLLALLTAYISLAQSSPGAALILVEPWPLCRAFPTASACTSPGSYVITMQPSNSSTVAYSYSATGVFADGTTKNFNRITLPNEKSPLLNFGAKLVDYKLQIIEVSTTQSVCGTQVLLR
jgi:hypothetical protein